MSQFTAVLLSLALSGAEPVPSTPGYMTLVVSNAVPSRLQSSSYSAVLAAVEKLAERYSVYYRINPTAASATVREPGCLPSTRSELHADVLLLYGLTGNSDSLETFVTISPCSAARGVGGFTATFTDSIMASDITEQSIRSLVARAFVALEAKISNDPDTAMRLGLTVNPLRP